MFKPGQSGNPKGRPKGARNKVNRKMDEAFDAAFDALQEDPKTCLTEWASQNPTEFYKLMGRRLTTAAENTNHVITETVTEEQAREMAEAFIESTRNRVGPGEPGCLHEGAAPGLQGGAAPPQNSESPSEG